MGEFPSGQRGQTVNASDIGIRIYLNIPLYRQEKIWKREGVALSRATLANAVGYESCDKLFALERKFETLFPKTRRQARQTRAKPLPDVHWAWKDKLDPAPGASWRTP